MAERSGDVYARILSRVAPQELREQCQGVVQQDAWRTHEQFAQLQRALHRLHEVRAATSRLLASEQSHDQLSGSSVQMVELLALRDRLTTALDALMQLPRSGSDVLKSALAIDKQSSNLRTATVVVDADKTQHLATQHKLPSVHDTPVKLLTADKVAVPIKQRYPSLVSTYTAVTGKRELERSGASHPTAHRIRKTEVTIDLSNASDDENFTDPKLFKSESECSQAHSCLTDAKLLWRSSIEAQSHQFPFLIKKLRNYLFARTHLNPNEAQEIAEAIEIAALMSMNPESVKPNDPSLADLLIAIDHLQAFAGGLIPLQMSKNINRFTAYLLATVTAASSAEVALGDPYIVQHGEDTVIRVNV